MALFVDVSVIGLITRNMELGSCRTPLAWRGSNLLRTPASFGSSPDVIAARLLAPRSRNTSLCFTFKLKHIDYSLRTRRWPRARADGAS